MFWLQFFFIYIFLNISFTKKSHKNTINSFLRNYKVNLLLMPNGNGQLCIEFLLVVGGGTAAVAAAVAGSLGLVGSAGLAVVTTCCVAGLAVVVTCCVAGATVAGVVVINGVGVVTTAVGVGVVVVVVVGGKPPLVMQVGFLSTARKQQL